MKNRKTFEEINEKIRCGNAVIVTAEEVSKMALTLSSEEIINEVDVVTTATFGPMCSSGAFLNFGHSDPPIRMEEISLNNVPASGGLAAVDTFIGATETAKDNPYYGGAHVICDLIDGKDVLLKARAKGTDCYPRKEIETYINKDKINEMILFNPRNAYQNYPAATNTASSTKYTYMGILLPELGNVTYSTSGELSPLLNDPELRTIGIGTKILLGGAEGFVAWNGTQFNTTCPKNKFGIPTINAATLAVIGNMKDMNTEFIRPAVYAKYGVSIFIGIGIPIPLLNEDIVRAVSIRNEQIETTICDYGRNGHPALGKTNYQQLQSGYIELSGKRIQTASLSSLYKARIIADDLKSRIQLKKFFLTEPVQLFSKNTSLKKLK